MGYLYALQGRVLVSVLILIFSAVCVPSRFFLGQINYPIQPCIHSSIVYPGKTGCKVESQSEMKARAVTTVQQLYLTVLDLIVIFSLRTLHFKYSV